MKVHARGNMTANLYKKEFRDLKKSLKMKLKKKWDYFRENDFENQI